MTSPEVATIAVVEHAPGMKAGCLACMHVIAQGKFAIGVQIGTYRYLVGNDPPIMHCGEEKKVPLFFDDIVSANEARDRIAEIINRDGTTENLKLLASAQFVSTATH